MIVVGLVFFFREPAFFLSPRLWAEEGSLYLNYAYSHSWWDAFVAPQLGYYSFFGNLWALLASRLIPFSGVAYFYLFGALAVQMIPLVIIWTSRAEIWKGECHKVLGIAMVLFTLLNGELWLTTTGSQFTFSLIAFLILLEPLNQMGAFRRWSSRVLLLISSCTGVLSLFLLPIYSVSLLWERSRERFIQLAVLLVGGVVQLMAFLMSYSEVGFVSRRFSEVSALLLSPVIFVRTLLLPFFGPETSQWFLEVYVQPTLSLWPFSLLWMMLMAAVLAFFVAELSHRERVVYVGSYLSLVLFSTVAALGSPGDFLNEVVMGQRYFYVPSLIMMILVFRAFQVAFQKKDRWISALLGFFLVLGLSQGVWHFRSSLFVPHVWNSWSSELQQSSLIQADQVEIWPEGWYVDVPKPLQ